jgi:hypothetical protein
MTTTFDESKHRRDAGGKFAPTTKTDAGIQIERSAGIPIDGTGYVAGGGHTGITENLDDQVQRSAEALAEHFGERVDIRFNSDRRSGGAYLRTSDDDGIWLNADVGVNWRAGSDTGVVRLSPEALRDWTSPDVLDNPFVSTKTADKESIEVGSVDEAMSIIRERCADGPDIRRRVALLRQQAQALHEDILASKPKLTPKQTEKLPGAGLATTGDWLVRPGSQEMGRIVHVAPDDHAEGVTLAVVTNVWPSGRERVELRKISVERMEALVASGWRCYRPKS